MCFACLSIFAVALASAATTSQKVTFYKDVLPVLQKNWNPEDHPDPGVDGGVPQACVLYMPAPAGILKTIRTPGLMAGCRRHAFYACLRLLES